MRLNWFSPLPPAQSGIADYTGDILPALAARAGVTLWTDQAKWDRRLEDHARVRNFQWQDMPWAEVHAADATIYQIGNSPEHHGAIWRVSRRHAGLVVLHDLKLQHLFGGLYRTGRLDDLQAYLHLMQRYYGPVISDVLAYWNSELHTNDMAERYPLSLLGVENALGVVAHSRPTFDAVRQGGLCPTFQVPLPLAATPRRAGADVRRPRQPPYRLTVFGYIGANRRLESVLEALGTLPERDRFRLDIYGKLWDESLVRLWVRAHGLQGQVTVHGYLAPAALDAALASTDLAINLRRPSMGEASSSQLRLWDHALPSLVTQADWYAELPADAVAFVRAEHEAADIRAHLRAFLEDPDRFAAMGARGRRALETCHAPEAYVADLLELAEMVPQLRGQAAARDLAQRLGAERGAWTNPASEIGLDRLSEEIHLLTQGPLPDPLAAAA